MGMFDKDKEIGLILQNFIGLGEQFVLYDARILNENYQTEMGVAVQCGLTVAKVDTPKDRYDTTTLASAIAAKVRDAEPDDFPAVCQLEKVPSRFGSDALVIRFLKPYGASQQPSTASPATGQAPGLGEDDIPF